MTDLSTTTEALFLGGFTNEVMYKIVLGAIFTEHRRVAFKGGKTINHIVVKNTQKSITQMYTSQEGLDVSSKEQTAEPSFGWKLGQHSIRYGVDVELQNQLATSEVKRIDLVNLWTEEAHRGVRLKMDEMFHATTAAGDSGSNFQGIPEACDHSRTYGGILSDTTFNSAGYWGGASLDDSFTDRDTSMALSLSNIRKAINRVERYVDAGRKVYGLLPEDLYSKFIGILEGKVVYEASNSDNSRLMKYGFRSFHAYGVEWVKDTYMTSEDSAMVDNMLLITPDTFELRLHPERAFNVTPFVWQADKAGGIDEMVARILFAGNLVCWQPNANMWKSNVT